MYYDQFTSYESVKDQVSSTYDLPPEEAIIYAGYSDPDGYSGTAIIVFTKDGKLYENNDSHCSCCSCNGLDTWNPEETSVEAILMRPEGEEGKYWHGWPGLRAAIKAYANGHT